MEKPIQRAGVIHDMVAFGKAGMMNILPIIANSGIEACPIPTMVFSTHTAYPNPAKRDLPHFVTDVLRHFREERVSLDTILVGYLGTEEIIDEVAEFVRYYKTQGTRIVFDPICGDHGSLYSNMTPAYAEHLRVMLPFSDIVLPNGTEAEILSGKTRPEEMTAALKAAGARNVIVTGVRDDGEGIDIATDTDIGYRLHTMPKVPQNMHGTGDVFAGLITAYYTKRIPLERAVEMAHRFIYRCITGSLAYEYDRKEGILLEKFIHEMETD